MGLALTWKPRPHKAALASPSRGDRTSVSSARLALAWRPRPTRQRGPYPHVETPPHGAALASPLREDPTSLSSARLALTWRAPPPASLSNARQALPGRPRPTGQRAPYPDVEAPPHKAAFACPHVETAPH